MPWTIDSELKQPYGDPKADWHVEFVSHDPDRFPAWTHMLVQFASRNVGEDEAKQIVADMLAGLNGRVPVAA